MALSGTFGWRSEGETWSLMPGHRVDSNRGDGKIVAEGRRFWGVFLFKLVLLFWSSCEIFWKLRGGC